MLAGLSYRCLSRTALSSNKLVSSLNSYTFDREQRQRVLSGRVIMWRFTSMCAVCVCGIVLKRRGIITFI